jgi:predicted RNA-binding protein with PUA-like domain
MLQRSGAVMPYWLLKSEPEAWSWAQQQARGAKGEAWTGVRNHQANNFMKAMKRGDLGFFYHSGAERAVVGIVEVIKEHAPDPSDETGKFGLVTVKAVRALEGPVSLAAIKADPALKTIYLVRNSRLSVQPVEPHEWARICELGGVEA